MLSRCGSIFVEGNPILVKCEPQTEHVCSKLANVRQSSTNWAMFEQVRPLSEFGQIWSPWATIRQLWILAGLGSRQDRPMLTSKVVGNAVFGRPSGHISRPGHIRLSRPTDIKTFMAATPPTPGPRARGAVHIIMLLCKTYTLLHLETAVCMHANVNSINSSSDACFAHRRRTMLEVPAPHSRNMERPRVISGRCTLSEARATKAALQLGAALCPSLDQVAPTPLAHNTVSSSACVRGVGSFRCLALPSVAQRHGHDTPSHLRTCRGP